MGEHNDGAFGHCRLPNGSVVRVDLEMGRWVGTLYAPSMTDKDTKSSVVILRSTPGPPASRHNTHMVAGSHRIRSRVKVAGGCLARTTARPRRSSPGALLRPHQRWRYGRATEQTQCC